MQIRSIITGQTVKPGEFEYSWQHFAMERQAVLEEKLGTTNLSPVYLKEDSELNAILEVLEKTLAQETFGKLHEAIFTQQSTAIYLHYNKGFFDGIKFAMMAGQL